MKLRRLWIFILTALLLVSFTACDDSDNNMKADVESIKSKKHLKIYYRSNDGITQAALVTFKDKYKDVDVEDTIFNDDDDYKNRLITDILSGEGPDVVFIKPDWIKSANKFLSSGVLCDLNEFIKKDKEFKMSDYYEKVLNSFDQGGKRLVIPIGFNFETVLISKQALQRNNIKIDPLNWNYSELLQVAKKYREENKGKNKYFFSKQFNISRMMKSCWISFVDYKNKKSLFDSKDFIEILEIYKGLYPSICPLNDDEESAYLKCLKEDIYVAEINHYGNHISSITYFNDLYKSLGNEMELFTLPSLKGNSSVVSYASEAVGINLQSKNKDSAYDFIKLLISKEFQTWSSESHIYTPAVPILKSSYEEDAKYCMSNSYGHDRGDSSSIGEQEIKLEPLPERLKTQLGGIISKVDRCEIEDREILNIVEEALPEFLNGKKTAAQTAKAIDEKVNLYLNE